MLEAGDILDGRYQLLRDLGRGAAGVVFEARHLFTGRFVAVKMVAPGSRASNVAELRARLQRESQAMASIRHPGVVEVLDGGVAFDGASYVVMEMLEGRTLEGLLAARSRLSVESTAAIAYQLCSALGAVHEAGIVHRDIKPSNIIVVRDVHGLERVKLVDFGIAKMDLPGGEKLTGAGAVVGTPEYMSPEQLLALDDVSHTSDVYGVGITMFECLSGGVPYAGSYVQVLLAATGEQAAPSVQSVAAHVPHAVARVVDRAIAKSRASRFASVEELASAIEAAVPSAREPTLLLGAPPPRKREPTSVDQRRRARRAPYNTPVHIAAPGKHGSAVDGRSEDISEGGMLVLSPATFPPEERVVVRLALPTSGEVVSIEARVRWGRTTAAPAQALGLRALGLEFVHLPKAAREVIVRYVDGMTERNQA
jgi:serine/threonine protein kinase